MFDRIDDFVWYLKEKDPLALSRILGDQPARDVMGFASLDEFLNSDSADYSDEVTDFLIDNGEQIDEGVIEHKGCDEWVYPGGVAETILYHCAGWYFYVGPEGQRHGLFASREEAEGESWKFA